VSPVAAAVLTALAPDPYRPGYRVVEVDRGRFASLPEDVLAPLGLGVGEPIPAAVLGRLHELADAEAALRAAVRLLALRGYARGELRRRLMRRQHPPAAVERAVETLAARGLLDDRAFAERYAATRARHGRGPARLVRDLEARGVERAVAEGAVAAALAAEGIEPRDEARRLGRRKLGLLEAFAVAERRRRLAAYLVRRGYTSGDALAVARELCPNS
jgi:regulatory protein